jgi:hypothetical protein
MLYAVGPVSRTVTQGYIKDMFGVGLEQKSNLSLLQSKHLGGLQYGFMCGL